MSSDTNLKHCCWLFIYCLVSISTTIIFEVYFLSMFIFLHIAICLAHTHIYRNIEPSDLMAILALIYYLFQQQEK